MGDSLGRVRPRHDAALRNAPALSCPWMMTHAGRSPASGVPSWLQIAHLPSLLAARTPMIWGAGREKRPRGTAAGSGRGAWRIRIRIRIQNHSPGPQASGLGPQHWAGSPARCDRAGPVWVGGFSGNPRLSKRWTSACFCVFAGRGARGGRIERASGGCLRCTYYIRGSGDQ